MMRKRDLRIIAISLWGLLKDRKGKRKRRRRSERKQGEKKK